MDYDAIYRTDRGTQKEVNQDSACAMVADTSKGPVCMAFLCDGMGGISLGEHASALVIGKFVRWFEEEFPERLARNWSLEQLAVEWAEILKELDREFRAYGEERSLKLGTTATGMLFMGGRYLLIQSGDSRAYEIAKGCRQLSEDQSYVQQQIDMGLLTPEEAKHHPKRNMLLNCIGGSRPSTPEWSVGKVKRNSHYLLCSDGFVHETSNEELAQFLTPGPRVDGESLGGNLEKIISFVKARGEKDNITALMVLTMRCRRKFEEKKFWFHVRERLLSTDGDIFAPLGIAVTESEE